MNEPILVPIKASEDLPKTNGYYYTNHGNLIFMDGVFYNKSIGNKCVIEIWYNPISEEEYFQQKLDGKMPSNDKIDLIISDESQQDWNRPEYKNIWSNGAKWGMNYIKSKLTEK